MPGRPRLLAGVPLLLPLTAFIAGICLWLWGLSEAGAIALATVLLVGVAASRYRIALLALMALAGIADGYVQIPLGPRTELLDTEAVYSGVIRDCRIVQTSQILTVRVDAAASAAGKPLKGIEPVDIRVIMPTFAFDPMPGYRLTFRSTLQKPDSIADLPYELSQADRLARHYIYMCTLTPEDHILSLEPDGSLRSRLMRLRDDIKYSLYGTDLSDSSKSFIATVLLGDTSDLSLSARTAFTSAGLSHVLALSGLHVAFITMFISLALWPLYYIGRRKRAFFVTILVLWFYAALTGFSPSVTRAVVMASVLLAAKMIHRRNSSLNSLCLAALVILIFSPADLTSIGFQLSFAAVLSILLFAESFNPVNRREHPKLYAVAALPAVSIAAVIGTALPAAYYFHTFPLYFLLGNLVATLLLPPLTGCALLVMIAGGLGFEASWLCSLTEWLYNLLDGSALLIGSMPGALQSGIYIPWYILLPYAAALLILKYWLVTRRRQAFITFCLLAVATVGCMIATPSFQAESGRLYLARSKQFTALVADGDGSRLDVIVANRSDSLNACHTLSDRYADFMGRRCIDSLHIAPSGYAEGPGYRLTGNLLQWGSHRLVILGRHSQLEPSGRVDYAIVCNGWRRSMEDVVRILKPDSVILAFDVNPRRAGSWSRQLDSLRQPYRSMRDGRSWSLKAD